MAKLRCGNCGSYVPKETAVRRGIQAFCDEECLKRNRPAPKRTDLDPLLRRRVIERDGGRCRWCGSSAPFPGLHVHHVRYRSEGGCHDEGNLITLCGNCHDRAHSDKRRFQPALLHLLKLHYEDGLFVTVETALHLVVVPAGGSGPGPH